MPLSDQALGWMQHAQMQAQQAEADARVDSANRAVEYYEGNTEAETLGYFDRQLVNQIAFANNNITQRIIKRISLVHKVKPNAIFPDDANEEAVKVYRQATVMDGVKLPRAERMLNLLKGIFLKSTFRNGRLELDIIRDFVPIFDGDPMQPVAVTYPVQASSEVTSTEGEVWAFWSADEQFLYLKGGEVLEREDPLQGKNPYGMLPGIFCFAEGAPPEEAFMNFMPCMDIIETNLSINLALTEMNANIRFQNFDYLYLEGVKNAGDITISQDAFTELPPGVKMGAVGISSHVADTITGVEFLYASIAQNYGLDAKFVQGVAPESGLALNIRNQELMENRAGTLENWRMIHRDLYKIRQAQVKYHFRKSLPDGMELDFHETEQVQTAQEKREQAEWKVQNGWSTYAQELLESNPDAFPGDPDNDITPLMQAEEHIRENLQKSAEFKQAGTPMTAGEQAIANALNQQPQGELE